MHHVTETQQILAKLPNGPEERKGLTMELNITEFFNSAPMRDYSASAAELGNNACAITWRNACDDAGDYCLLDTAEKRDSFRDYVRGFGAWTDDEIVAWTDTELNALCMQMIAGDVREFRELAKGDWQEWESLCNAGKCIGNLFGGSLSTEGQVYYHIGN